MSEIKTDLKSSLKSIGNLKMHHKEMRHGKSQYSDSSLKPDKTCHDKHEDMGTMAKKTKLPGQMYVPAKDHDEADFAGEER
jgi:hypothetical protein